MKPIREYRWVVQNDSDLSSLDSPVVKKLSDELSISNLLASLLVRRGIDTYEKSRKFFRPSLEDLYDPFLMDGMKIAVTRIIQAIKKQEAILIYGDYDVDGTNSTALLYSFLTKAGSNASFYIPDRVKDGYGVSKSGIKIATDRGVKLLITVDCGITANEQVELAREAGIDVIICDHHEPGDSIPNAVAVLDPLKPGCPYPFKYLCGCGVAFKLAQALIRSGEFRSLSIIDEYDLLSFYLDMVTLATTADIVPLVDENRIFVKLGLEHILTDPRPGIRALIDIAGMKLSAINVGKILFGLAPRINALGRVGDANRAVELLISSSYDDAYKIAQICEKENINRRKLDEETFTHAIELAEEIMQNDKNKAIVLHQSDWHAGVIGIVASRLVERFYRPSIMLTTINGFAKGSARSIPGFDIHSALKRCEHLIEQFGGHKFAAGVTIRLDKVDEFISAFQEVASEMMTKDTLTPTIEIDAEVELSEITPKFIRIINQFGPFGPQNPRPTFVLRNAELYGKPRIVGSNHLRFKIRCEGKIFDTIGFDLGGWLPKFTPDRKFVDLVFTFSDGEYAGAIFPQLIIKDIK